MFSLIKIIFLLRVFKSLNFLVTMLFTVVNEVMYFFLLFTVFLITFGECMHIVDVDIGGYGRLPVFFAHFFGSLRISMGDQAPVDPYQTFDLNVKHPVSGKTIFNESLTIVMFTWFIWLLMNFFLFMVFMNFIIAVIGETYSKVVEFKKSHDYLIRVSMIYERELNFNKQDL